MSEHQATSTANQWWWIATNGASCAAAPAPSRSVPSVVPTPEQLIGYRTQHEQLEAQRLILWAPMEQVNEYLGALPRRIRIGEIKYVRPNGPEPSTQGQTRWILSGGSSFQEEPPRQLQNSTSTPTLLSLIPKELIEPLKKLGNTDWLNIVTEPLCHRLELDESVLLTLQDHPHFCKVLLRLAESMPRELLQFLAYSKILANGPKIVQPTPAQCEALAHVDLNLKFREYEQPFPAFVVEIPIEIQRQLTKEWQSGYLKKHFRLVRLQIFPTRNLKDISLAKLQRLSKKFITLKQTKTLESKMPDTPLKAQIKRDQETAAQISDNDRVRYERQLKSVVDRSSFYRFSNGSARQRA